MARVSGSIVRLTHFGRKTGKAYRVKVWFVVLDGHVWIGSLDRNRSWVKNLRAGGKGELDFGSGPVAFECEWVPDAAEIERFGRAAKAKYWILGPILQALVSGERCAFKTSLAADS